MSDTPKNPTETVVPASTDGAGAGAAGNAGGEGAAGAASTSTTDEDKWKGLPDEFAWVKDELSGARNDAGKYRTQLREAETRLQGAKTPEEVEAALADQRKANEKLELDLTREQLARTHKLDDDEVALLNTATTIEAVKTTAAQVAKLREKHLANQKQITKVPLSGGTTPGPQESPADPGAAYARYKRNR